MQRLDITRHYNIHMLIKTNVIFIYKSKDCVKRHRNVIIFNEIISHNCVCLSTIQVMFLPNILLGSRPMYDEFFNQISILLLIRNTMFM